MFTTKGDFSVFEEDIVAQAINAYVKDWYSNGRLIDNPKHLGWLPFDVINRHLTEIDYINFRWVVRCYYRMTYERTLELNSAEHTCVYLHTCKTLPKNIDFNSLHDVFVRCLVKTSISQMTAYVSL